MTLDDIIRKQEKTMTKKYIITSAQAGASINTNFYNGLIKYSKVNNAEIIVIPMRGAYKEDGMIHKRFYSNLDITIIDSSVKELKLNNNIRIMNYDVTPQQIVPITGIERFARDDTSTIIPATKIFERVIPNSNTKSPKVLLTTGAVTHGNYRDNRIGRIAQIDHSYGALLVEVSKKDYQFRHLNASKNGVFYDLGVRYNGNNKPVNERPEVVVLGDWHTGDTDVKVRKETFAMIETYKPKKVIVHDFFNASSINHWDMGKIVTLATKNLSLENEIRLAAKELKIIHNILPKDSELYIVKSNHDEHLDRYIQEARFINEPQNTFMGAKLLVSMLQGQDPLVSAISMFYDIPKNVHFLTREEDLKVRGYQLSNHGDLGSNGGRGSPRSIERANGKSITGHGHYPLIFRGVYKVGTSTRLNLGYNRGYNNWLNTHAFLYKNGQPQLVNIFKGRHRL